MTIAKQKIVDKYFALKFDTGRDVDRLISRLKTYLNSDPDDREMRFLQLKLQIGRLLARVNDFDTCSLMAKPMFDELLGCQQMTYLEVNVLARVIEVAPTYAQAKEASEKLMDLLETKYSQEPKCKNVKWIISINMAARLLVAKYPDAHMLAVEGDQKEIQALFLQHIEFAKEVAERNNLDHWLAYLHFKEGLFFANVQLTEESLNQLKELSVQRLYPDAIADLVTYHNAFGDELSTKLHSQVTGRLVRRALREHQIAEEDVAELFGMNSTSFQNLLRGSRRFQHLHLLKLSLLMDKPVTYFTPGPRALRSLNTDHIDEPPIFTMLKDLYFSSPPAVQECIDRAIKSVVSLARAVNAHTCPDNDNV